MSAKANSVIKISDDALKEGNAVVITFQTTGEVEAKRDIELQKRELASAPALSACRIVRNIFHLTAEETKDYEKFKLKETHISGAVILSLLGKAHDGTIESKNQTHTLVKALKPKVYKLILMFLLPADINEQKHHWDPAYTALIKKRYKFERMIEEMDLPGSAIDQIIGDLGGPTKVAELTGRESRLIRLENGEFKFESRCEGNTIADKNRMERRHFMNGLSQ